MSTRVPVTAPADQPLGGHHILLTRVRGDNEPLRQRLELLGATVLELPTIEILPPEDPGPLETALRALDRYRWICFTSRNAVRAVAQMLDRMAVSLAASTRVAAIGPATSQELAARGIGVDCLPDMATGDALAVAMLLTGAAGTRVLLPQSDRARPELRDGLIAGGALVDTVIAYRTGRPPPNEALALVHAGRIDVVVLTSPSGLHGLLDMVGDNREAVAGTRFACIGPTTASAVLDAGFVPAAVAPNPSLEGIVQAIRASLETRT